MDLRKYIYQNHSIETIMLKVNERKIAIENEIKALIQEQVESNRIILNEARNVDKCQARINLLQNDLTRDFKEEF